MDLNPKLRKPVWIGLALSAALVFAVLLVWMKGRTNGPPLSSSKASGAVVSGSSAPGQASQTADQPTNIYAHNLLLRKGPKFRIYIPWLRGYITHANSTANASLDDPESFYLDITSGILHANLGDVSAMLNSGVAGKARLTNIKISGSGNQLKINGILHKVFPLPVELDGNMTVASGNRIQVHVTKLNVLKIPFKALLGSFHVKVSDLFHPKGVLGIQVVENEIFFDPQQLLPPPHIRGKLMKVRIANPDLEEVYGDAEHEVAEREQWRNFLRLKNGTLDFGKLTMHHVDLMMIDLSNDAWFDLDLANYQEQLVNGYTRMTPQAGLQIFMPDLDQIANKKDKQNTSIQWFKNRNAPPPADVTSNR